MTQITEAIAKNAFIFLQRAELKGAEAGALLEVMKAIKESVVVPLDLPGSKNPIQTDLEDAIDATNA